ncbi:glycerophosphodiester phosphodiesterase [Streptomyces boninensis]|uniref:glycerophosphodiester phosphodiesterase n=1 Tax=Streptomyces boninensis TaxID=2039455 RepID=UPI003B224967
MLTTYVVAGLTTLATTAALAPGADAAGRVTSAAELPGIVYTAHRGGALEAPENSMSALRASYRDGRAHVLDFDTRMLRDGTLVVIHDATLDRTTNLSGPVRNLTAAQWKKVRLQPDSSLRARFRPEPAPTVAQVLREFGGKAVLTMEAKDPASIPRIAAELERRGLTRSVYVNTNSPAAARRVHQLGLLSQLWRSKKQMRHDHPKRWRGFVDVFDVDHRARPQDLRKFAKAGAGRVWAHTVNTVSARDRAARYGCDGFETDAPGLLSRTPMG